jgi:hypothetical protein
VKRCTKIITVLDALKFKIINDFVPQNTTIKGLGEVPERNGRVLVYTVYLAGG